MTVAAILKHKGTDVASVGPTRTIAEVARLLSSRRIGAVTVCDADERLLGILSERDVMYALASHGAATLQMTARQLMTVTVQVATPDMTVHEALRAMTEGRFRHMPVIVRGRLVGIVSIGDVVKAKLMQQEAEVDGLRAYVAGSA
jgi:CBS domain-containing protein